MMLLRMTAKGGNRMEDKEIRNDLNEEQLDDVSGGWWWPAPKTGGTTIIQETKGVQEEDPYSSIKVEKIQR